MIEAYEMAAIYWRRARLQSLNEVMELSKKLKSPGAQIYWNEVLGFLKLKTEGKKIK